MYVIIAFNKSDLNSANVRSRFDLLFEKGCRTKAAFPIWEGFVLIKEDGIFIPTLGMDLDCVGWNIVETWSVFILLSFSNFLNE